MGCRVLDLGFRLWGFRIRVQGSWFMVHGLESMFRLWVKGVGVRV
jgi:hypothetical protein